MLKAKSYTRLTLGLDIIGKLTEGPFKGYHELGIVKQKISLADEITVEASDQLAMSCNHPGVPEDDRNICWQAAELLQQEGGVSENVSIDIQKVIPVQGGLAGGSTNAATVIDLLDKHWGLGLGFDDKVRLGRKLGMDVPFYFTDNCAFDTESTGVLEPIRHNLKLYFLLVVPPFGVSTADAYGGIDYEQVGKKVADTEKIIASLENGAYDEFVRHIHNDFELSVFKKYEKLNFYKNQLVESGADAAFMSGSGSTMVGVFDSIAKVEDSAKIFSKSFVVESL